MIIKGKETDMAELSIKIVDSVNQALRKLVEESAARNESLIVGDGATGFKSVPAKELLKELPKK